MAACTLERAHILEPGIPGYNTDSASLGCEMSTTCSSSLEITTSLWLACCEEYPDHGMASREMDIAVIAGVIAAVAFVLVCLLFLMLHYMYRHKGTYHTNEAKGTEFAESADAALQDDPSLQDNGDSSGKEYFI
ncbi:glycophorin-C isoform X1 [Delphinapterus leucas]|uniref:Glycophorin-C isoform X1 n=1 Tax=Delphinapterus leucas TaxID=9749 RepID=A0A2Y9PM07_DELLE|nr:glycophorin-C isoform X1 [Delphinapterus leucas]